MDIEELRSKTKKELLELAKKANINMKTSVTKAELFDTLKVVYNEKLAPKLERKIRKPISSRVKVKEKSPEKKAEGEGRSTQKKAVYQEKTRERIITKQKGYPVRGSRVTFNIEKSTNFGQNLFLAGNIPELGNWDPDRALPCDSSHYSNWSATANIPAGTSIEFKFLIKNADGSIIWEREGKGNRIFKIPAKAREGLAFYWEP